MIRQATLDKLHDMRLSSMANAYEEQYKNAGIYENLSFDDRFGMIVDRQFDKKQSTKVQNLLKQARLRYPNACVEDIEYRQDRKLDKTMMTSLSTSRFIEENHHVLLMGAPGCGKTYIACALGVSACRNYKRVRYIRLPELLDELSVAHGEGIFQKVISSYKKCDLLILDDFLLTPITGDQAKELFEVIEAKTVRGSVIFCTQFEPGGWFGRIGSDGDMILVESIVDRVKPASYAIEIGGSRSMREVHGLNAAKDAGQSAGGECDAS